MPAKKALIRRLILAVLGFLIILFERIITELSPAGESKESRI